MKNLYRLILIISLALVITACGNGDSDPNQELADKYYLPLGSVDVDVMEVVGLTPQLIELSNRDFDAFLTEIEGRELLEASSQADLDIAVVENQIVISGGDEIPNMTEVIIDLETEFVLTPFGTISQQREVEPVEDQYLTGAWTGLQWRFINIQSSPEGTLSSGGTTDSLVIFSLGELEETGRGLMTYVVQVSEGGELIANSNIILMYDLAGDE